MPPRNRKVLAGVTAEERRRERKKVGKLRHQIVTQSTELRYKDTFREFRKYHNLRTDFTIEAPEDFDEMVGEYIEALWEGGAPKSQANYTLAAIQYHRPQTKSHLPWSWRLVKAWNQVEIPQRATPMSPQMLLGYCGVALRWGHPVFAGLLQVGFSTFLRTGELLALTPLDVTLGRDSAVIFINASKGTKRKLLPLERVEVEDATALRALRVLMRRTRGRETFWRGSRQEFLQLWHHVTQHLELQNLNLKPYSLPRGGATSAYRNGATLDALLTKGRWQSASTARIYLDTGLQALVQLTLPAPAHSRVTAGVRDFFKLSQ